MAREEHTITTGTLRDAVAEALAAAVPPGMTGGDRHGQLVIFAGEGDTARSALEAAIGNIRALCDDHRCRPLGATADGVVRTDDGVRIWGTLECAPEEGREGRGWSAPEIGITQDGEGRWTVTISAP